MKIFGYYFESEYLGLLGLSINRLLNINYRIVMKIFGYYFESEYLGTSYNSKIQLILIP
jgi:hypothetical protein